MEAGGRPAGLASRGWRQPAAQRVKKVATGAGELLQVASAMATSPTAVIGACLITEGWFFLASEHGDGSRLCFAYQIGMAILMERKTLHYSEEQRSMQCLADCTVVCM
ncbi:hypothetical protein PVAP13_7NG307500 [Panicum virgatum]|uniref:Uncharacterized protein n=1 Tax=Panicum virgatum TaxID=38727 RepID=A0A8T0QDI5_PANVG|nr:hypothetical protein PVAP13_7NG307500 [Panicum virgatum]